MIGRWKMEDGRCETEDGRDGLERLMMDKFRRVDGRVVRPWFLTFLDDWPWVRCLGIMMKGRLKMRGGIK